MDSANNVVKCMNSSLGTIGLQRFIPIGTIGLQRQLGYNAGRPFAPSIVVNNANFGRFARFCLKSAVFVGFPGELSFPGTTSCDKLHPADRHLRQLCNDVTER